METFMAFVFFATLKKAGLNLAIFGREKSQSRFRKMAMASPNVFRHPRQAEVYDISPLGMTSVLLDESSRDIIGRTQLTARSSS
jgi:hypothetical protein